jgi:glycosyltransferase involved in cell wall biosynthesis
MTAEKNKIVSIAIAAYNMEKYLKRCLDSVLISSIIDKIEIIIVNDGSTDGSLAIMESYKSRFPQSIIVINKQNGKAGSCRNAALKTANGKYFKILDADDWFDSDAFVKYIETLEKINVDMVLTNYSREFVSGGSKILTTFQKNDVKNIIPGNEYDFSKLDLDNCLLAMHSITYRTELLTEIDFEFTEGISYTDTEYVFYPISHVKSYTYLDMILYKHYIGREGQSISASSLVKNKEHFCLLIRKMVEYLQHDNCSDRDKRVRYFVLESLCCNYYIAILIFNKKNNEDDTKLRNIDDLIKRTSDELYAKIETRRYCRVHFVKIWRRKNQYCDQILFYKILFGIRKAKPVSLIMNVINTLKA